MVKKQTEVSALGRLLNKQILSNFLEHYTIKVGVTKDPKLEVRVKLKYENDYDR
jgi:hypothetical protein